MAPLLTSTGQTCSITCILAAAVHPESSPGKAMASALIRRSLRLVSLFAVMEPPIFGVMEPAAGARISARRPGQRQSISAASAVSAKGEFWFCFYEGALNAELFVDLLGRMMMYRWRPGHLVLDSLPEHKKAHVAEYVASTEGRLTLHFLPGYAPELNPDEMVWSHVKRTGVARRPLRKGEKLSQKIAEQLSPL